MNTPLRDVPVFAGLSEEALKLLLTRAHEAVFKAGDFVLKEGETGNQMYVIGSGSVRVCKGIGTSREIELAILRDKDFFGEMCILETLPRAATVQALTDCRLVAIPAMAFYDLYTTMPKQHSIAILNIARDLSRRLRRLEETLSAGHPGK